MSSRYVSRKFLEKLAADRICNTDILDYGDDEDNNVDDNDVCQTPQKKPKPTKEERNRWLTASRVVKADNLQKKNDKKAPADVRLADVIANPQDKSQLKILCTQAYEFLANVTKERKRITLLKPPGRKRYSWWCDEKLKLRALLPAMRKALYPLGIPKPAKHRSSSDSLIGTAVDAAVCDYFRRTAGSAFLKFHEEMNCEEECKLRLSKPCSEFGEDDEEAGGKGLSVTDDRNKETHRKMLTKKYFDALITQLEKKGIAIIAVQVVLFDEKQRIISFADIIGICFTTCRIVILELKTGSDYAYEYAAGTRMLAPLEDIPCSKKNIHLLQLWWYLHTCREWYGLVEATYEDAYLIKVNSTNTKVKPIACPDGTVYHMNGEWYKLDKWMDKKKYQISEALKG